VNLRDFFTYLATSDEEGCNNFRRHFSDLLSAAGVDSSCQVVICEDKLNNGFGQSCRGWLIMQALGHKNASVLENGFFGWQAAGLSISHEVEQPERSEFKIDDKAIDEIFVDKQDMLRALHDHDIRILDIRDQDEWEGLSSSPYGPDFAARKGRLERSVWLQWDKLTEEDAGYLSEEHIVAAMRQLGISQHQTIRISHCYDLMDSAYDAPQIREQSTKLGHIALIDINPRRDKALKEALRAERRRQKVINLQHHEHIRYNERSTVERVNGRFKDEFGGRAVRVKGETKVMCHLMFGIVALTVDQLMKLIQ